MEFPTECLLPCFAAVDGSLPSWFLPCTARNIYSLDLPRYVELSRAAEQTQLWGRGTLCRKAWVSNSGCCPAASVGSCVKSLSAVSRSADVCRVLAITFENAPRDWEVLQCTECSAACNRRVVCTGPASALMPKTAEIGAQALDVEVGENCPTLLGHEAGHGNHCSFA